MNHAERIWFRFWQRHPVKRRPPSRARALADEAAFWVIKAPPWLLARARR